MLDYIAKIFAIDENRVVAAKPSERFFAVSRSYIGMLFIFAIIWGLLGAAGFLQKETSIRDELIQAAQLRATAQAMLTNAGSVISQTASQIRQQIQQLQSVSQNIQSITQTIPQDSRTAAPINELRRQLGALSGSINSLQDIESQSAKAAQQLHLTSFDQVQDASTRTSLSLFDVVSPAFAQRPQRQQSVIPPDPEDIRAVLYICFLVPLFFVAGAFYMAIWGPSPTVIKFGLDTLKTLIGFYIGAGTTLLGISLR